MRLFAQLRLPHRIRGFAKGTEMRRFILLLAILLSFPWDAVAYDDLMVPKVAFSAVAVQEAGASKIKETIHYADGKLRIDRGDGFSTTILDLMTQTQCLLMADHTYLVMPMDDELLRKYIPRTVDMSDSRKLGTARVGGQETRKYEFGNDGALNAAGTYWLTPSGIMVRREYRDGLYGRDVHRVYYLTDISVANQPASFFKIPAGYRLAK
jgi:hypothetical protein